MIFCISFYNSNVRKPFATGEGTRADVRHAVGDCHARKPGATPEGRIADARHTVGDCYAR